MCDQLQSPFCHFLPPWLASIIKETENTSVNILFELSNDWTDKTRYLYDVDFFEWWDPRMSLARPMLEGLDSKFWKGSRLENFELGFMIGSYFQGPTQPSLINIC